MSKQLKYFLTIAGLIVLGGFFLFLFNCIDSLARFSARIHPAAEPWVFWILAGLVLVSLAWWLLLILTKPRPIMVHASPTPEEMERFRAALLKRLARNKLLKADNIRVRTEEDMDMALTVLRERADREIRDTAKRVFVGSAVSQNGRLDALVVLFLISRLVWRISKIYCQRPRGSELINLYVNIAATSFLAGSIDEFGIEEYVHELMAPMVAGSALGAMPGAEAIAGTVTSSILSGSTNALLSMRCGVVARNYMSLQLDAKGVMRRSATLEAAKMFMSISGETVTEVTRLLVKGSTGAVRKQAGRAARGVGRTVTGAAGKAASGAKSAGRGVRDSAKSVGRGVTGSARSMADGVDRTVDRAANSVKDSARKVGRSARGLADDINTLLDKSEAGLVRAADKVKTSVRSVRDKVTPGRKTNKKRKSG